MVALRLRPAIVLFGDSLTQQGFGVDGRIGWASLLASDYSRRADVLNRGYSGYNTKMAIDLFPSLFSSGSPSESNVLFCTVYFGANDAALPGERQHVPLEDYGKNLATIITKIRESTASPSATSANNETCSDNNNRSPPVILLTPPPFDPAAWRRERNLEVDGRANDVAKSYGDMAKSVAASYNCSVVDVWQMLGGHTSPDVYGRYLSDGLHLSEEGNRKVYQGLIELIRRDHPSLAPMEEGMSEGVPLEGKPWAELC